MTPTVTENTKMRHHPCPQPDGHAEPDAYAQALDELARALIRATYLREGSAADRDILPTAWEWFRYQVAPLVLALGVYRGIDQARAEAIRDLEDSHEIDILGCEGILARFAIDYFVQRLIVAGRTLETPDVRGGQ